MRRPIVAGVDSSSGGIATARYAARLAQRRDAPLLLVHVFEGMFRGYGPIMMAAGYAMADEEAWRVAEKWLGELATGIRDAYPELTVNERIRDGSAAGCLIAESSEALATVVGSRGLGGFSGLLLGSVSAQVAAHGHGPVVIVRPAAEPDGPILVGYDGSDAARAALDYGVREAIDQKRKLVVANVYWEETPGNALALVVDAVETITEEHPELVVETRTIHSRNNEYSLTQESAHASLTVVGCRGRGGFAGLLLGSVSRTLIHHAAGPVAVVHAHE